MTTNTAPANTNSNPYAVAYGDKYEQGLDVAEIAKRVRADIKVAITAGELPAAKYSVRISRYSMGRSLYVTVDGVPFAIVHEARVRRDVLEPHAYHAETLCLHTDEARALLAKVEAIVAAYNFDGSDSQSDYSHVNFYAHVDFSNRQEQAEREALRAKYEATKGMAPAPVVPMTDEEDARLEAREAAVRAEMARDARRDACPAAAWHEPHCGCALCE